MKKKQKRRINIIVLDSFGCGELPDANEYGDEGSNTLENIYFHASSLNLPNLKQLGLYNIPGLHIPEKLPEEEVMGCYGKCAELSKGKNSPVGHWEIAGFVKEEPFATFPNGFPQELLDKIIAESGIPGFLSNEKGSGTDLLDKYGEEMMHTHKPIVYTSADSVFQIAAHEEIYSPEELYRICEVARNVIDRDNYNIGTVIARPYVGTCPSDFKRTYNRKDFEFTGFGKTMLDYFVENGKSVLAIGKIQDLFCGRSITEAIHTNGNEDGINQNIKALQETDYDLIFTNLVDYDMLYGHRNDVEGYARALEYFDSKLPEIIGSMRLDDILIITADHGCDPYTPSTDHSREYIPLLVYGKTIKTGSQIGVRGSYADIAATVMDIYHMQYDLKFGTTFKDKLM